MCSQIFKVVIQGSPRSFRSLLGLPVPKYWFMVPKKVVLRVSSNFEFLFIGLFAFFNFCESVMFVVNISVVPGIEVQ